MGFFRLTTAELEALRLSLWVSGWAVAASLPVGILTAWVLARLHFPGKSLMDEPLASLDAARKSEVLPFIMRLSREFAVPILYVSHALDEILNLATQMVIMEEGRILAYGDPEDLLSRPDLQNRSVINI